MPKHPPNLRCCFTLTELLVVMMIMGIMMGLVLAPFGKLLSGSGVDAGARMLSAQLRLARQYAITQRKKVAVVMPGNEGPEDGRFTSLAVYQDDSGTWNPVQNTKREFLPAGSAIDPAPAQNVTVGATTYSRSVIFKATGALFGSGGDVTISVVEGFFNGTAVTTKNASNKLDITINQYTGRVKIEEP